MTPAKIRAELRRSACEDENPFIGIDYPVFDVVIDEWADCYDNLLSAFGADDVRTLYLLVAEALES